MTQTSVYYIRRGCDDFYSQRYLYCMFSTFKSKAHQFIMWFMLENVARLRQRIKKKKLLTFFFVQNPHMEQSKYQTLPGKMSKKSELREHAELNGDRERNGEYLSPVQLSPVHNNHDQDYSLSEYLHV